MLSAAQRKDWSQISMALIYLHNLTFRSLQQERNWWTFSRKLIITASSSMRVDRLRITVPRLVSLHLHQLYHLQRTIVGCRVVKRRPKYSTKTLTLPNNGHPLHLTSKVSGILKKKSMLWTTHRMVSHKSVLALITKGALISEITRFKMLTTVQAQNNQKLKPKDKK